MNIAAYPKYKSYRGSGVEWLGSIPDEWEVRRFRFLCSITTGERNTEDKEENGQFPFFVRSQTPERINSYSYDGEAILTAGDGAGVGRVYHYVNGKFDFHQRVYKFSDFRDVVGKYLFHYLAVNFASVALLGTAKSTVDSLRLPLIQDFPVALPRSEVDQIDIVRFLDGKCAAIDEAVRIKEEQIRLLRERRQILIQQAVTRGLNPDAPMKDSGIDWIGQIPEHWEVRRGKHLFREVNERSEEGKEELLSVSHTTGVTARSEKNVNMFMAEDYTGSKLCQPGDVVINTMWAWMGALGVSGMSGIVSPSYGVYRPLCENAFNPYFLEWLLRTTPFIEQYNKISSGLHSSRLRLYPHMFLGLPMAFPNRDEQDVIVTSVNKEAGKVDRAISIKQDQITALKEYKTTLINAAVTGKIKITEDML